MEDFIMNDSGFGSSVYPKLNNKAFQDRDGFIVFYSPKCPHCIRFAPTLKELANKLSKVLSIGTVNCENVVKSNHVLADLYDISYLPQIKYYNHLSGEFIDYTGGQKINELLTWLCQVRNICHT
jgi:thiol-disulfide isomerase/thioredoxin